LPSFKKKTGAYTQISGGRLKNGIGHLGSIRFTRIRKKRIEKKMGAALVKAICSGLKVPIKFWLLIPAGIFCLFVFLYQRIQPFKIAGRERGRFVYSDSGEI
jgi:hypothetical protein